MKDVFIKQIQSILEFDIPVWNCSLTKGDNMDIERVQKAILHLALGDVYRDYSSALKICNLDILENRRTILCTNFAQKSAKHPKHKHWFEPNQNAPGTRSLNLNIL